MRVHQEYIKEEKPQWANRTDYVKENTIAQTIIGDVLSNDGVVKLLKKLYALSKNKFNIFYFEVQFRYYKLHVARLYRN